MLEKARRIMMNSLSDAHSLDTISQALKLKVEYRLLKDIL